MAMASSAPAIDEGRDEEADSRVGSAGSFRAGLASSDASSFCRTSFDSTSSSSAGSSSSPWFSTRCQTLAQRRLDSNLSELDFQIEASKDHWSELSSVVVPQRRKQQGLLGRVFFGRKVEKLHSVESLEQMREAFERLKSGPHSFFQDFEDLELRGKIAEGGQAEIFEAEYTLPSGRAQCVVKVMKDGFSMQSLQSQWSPHLRRRLSRHCSESHLVLSDASVSGTGTSSIIGGTLLPDGRFAFVMEKYCTDLRKLIDLRMLENGNRGPPFKPIIALRIIGQIARGMYTLHKSNILHRDLKASNVLVTQFSTGNFTEYPDCYIADFECSVGVIGTGFWRAPEILLALKNRTVPADACSHKADVYSFGMTCFEVLTGCMPFEGAPMTNYDLVLSGHRPVLPDHVNANVKALVLRCWDTDPHKRPSFKKILKLLAREVESLRLVEQVPFYGWESSRTWYLERYSDLQEEPEDEILP